MNLYLLEDQIWLTMLYILVSKVMSYSTSLP
uniref:Uncharacterized protein n=1 Tax=Heterorhabditis bacteriophora TaxID=37862 RepID=A0A1I7WH60_HETBA